MSRSRHYKWGVIRQGGGRLRLEPRHVPPPNLVQSGQQTACRVPPQNLSPPACSPLQHDWPKDCSLRRRPACSRMFATVEVDTSTYAIPRADVTARWGEGRGVQRGWLGWLAGGPWSHTAAATPAGLQRGVAERGRCIGITATQRFPSMPSRCMMSGWLLLRHAAREHVPVQPDKSHARAATAPQPPTPPHPTQPNPTPHHTPHPHTTPGLSEQVGAGSRPRLPFPREEFWAVLQPGLPGRLGHTEAGRPVSSGRQGRGHTPSRQASPQPHVCLPCCTAAADPACQHTWQHQQLAPNR